MQWPALLSRATFLSKLRHLTLTESGDILIQIAPSDVDGLHIELDSTVAYQFGEQIKKVIINTLKELGINKANVKATDKGALDCTIKARVTAAAVRSTGVDVWA